MGGYGVEEVDLGWGHQEALAAPGHRDHVVGVEVGPLVVRRRPLLDDHEAVGIDPRAVEDAWVLADRLASEPSPEAAFAAYERMRMPKARMVVNTSWRFGKMVHLSNPLARGARNLLLRLAPEALARRQTDAFYRLNY